MSQFGFRFGLLLDEAHEFIEVVPHHQHFAGRNGQAVPPVALIRMKRITVRRCEIVTMQHAVKPIAQLGATADLPLTMIDQGAQFAYGFRRDPDGGDQVGSQ